MTTHDFLANRRRELVEFFSWRFGTPYWTGPLAFVTGLPRPIAWKLRRCPVEFSIGPRPKGVTVRDIVRAEIAARHLGFRPTYPNLTGYRLCKPPPLNLPKWADPLAKVRFKDWRRYNQMGTTKRERERKRVELLRRSKTRQKMPKSSLYDTTHTVPSAAQMNNSLNNNSDLGPRNQLPINPDSA